MTIQKGYVWRVKNSWYGRWYAPAVDAQGRTVRRQTSEKLCEFSDRYRSKKDVRVLLAEKLAPINEGRCRAESSMLIEEYVESSYFPFVESELKPSTAHGYRGLWRMYLKPSLSNVALRDFTCGRATRLLAELHASHRLSRKSLRNCKGLLQSIFAHAKRNDVIAGENPVKGAGIPRAAASANRRHAYTVDDVMQMLNALDGTARAAVALMFFTALRPGECRAIKWADWDESKRVLNVSRSIWRKHETGPKTEESVAPVPVAEALRKILTSLPRSSEYILSTPSGRPIDLHNLAARSIVPALKCCAVCHEPESEHGKSHAFKLLPEWKGFYALRRGIGTALADVDSAVAAKSVLRHSNVSTTTAHYVKSVDTAGVRAMDKIDVLFDNDKSVGRPN